jgi:Na+/H+ antiporter NhaA
MLGLVAGKFLGVFSFSWIAIKTKVASMPSGASWKSFASVCVLCGIGFTVSMFIADLAYSPLGASGRQILDLAKLGILCGTIISAVVGALLLGWLIDSETMTTNSIGYGSMVILLAASALGALVAKNRIKHRTLVVCLLSGTGYYLSLLSITALFFGGEYHGFWVGSILIMAASVISAFLPLLKSKKGTKIHRKIYTNR